MGDTTAGGIRAVIFDVGGVLTTAPATGVRRFCEESGVAYDGLVRVISASDGAWSRYEAATMTEPEFVVAFEAECRHAGLQVDARRVVDLLGASMALRPEMMETVRRLRGPYRLGCITNVAGDGEDHSWKRFGLDLEALFDVVVVSAQVGMRKPDPRIYELACRRLQILPQEAVFLDDAGINLKAARALGMVTIKVDETTRAIEELESTLGVPLLAAAGQQQG